MIVVADVFSKIFWTCLLLLVVALIIHGIWRGGGKISDRQALFLGLLCMVGAFSCVVSLFARIWS